MLVIYDDVFSMLVIHHHAHGPCMEWLLLEKCFENYKKLRPDSNSCAIDRKTTQTSF